MVDYMCMGRKRDLHMQASFSYSIGGRECIPPLRVSEIRKDLVQLEYLHFASSTSHILYLLVLSTTMATPNQFVEICLEKIRGPERVEICSRILHFTPTRVICCPDKQWGE